MHGVLPVEAFGVTTWPAAVPVQLHQMIDDPFRTPSNVDAFVATVRSAGAPIEQYDYPGHGHLFADSGLSDYDRDAAALMLQRVLTGLHRMHSAS
jgi:dienelactone hydrolase